MRPIIIITLALIGFSASARTTNVHGYTKKNGKYVQPHHRTSPNKTKKDNWSHKGNVNPYTEKKGTKK